MIEQGAWERRMLERWQRGFPLLRRPFAVLAEEAGVSEAEAIAAVRRLSEAGVICRVGAVVRPNTAGASTLAALSVPAERLEEVAAMVSAQPEVTHNYEREHAFNLWFVVTAADHGAVRAALSRIRAETSLEVLDLPMKRAYHIDLGFSMKDGRAVSPCRAAAHEGRGAPYALSGFDRELLAAIEDGLPIVREPYAEAARWLGVGEEVVRGRLEALLEAGVISRFGFVVHHRELGYCANAMVVWDIPDERLDAAAAVIAGEDCVTLCYERPRRPPVWRYNLFCMIHGTSRDVVLEQVAALEKKVRVRLGRAKIAHEVLFSLRRFKQCGARFSAGLKKKGAA